MKTGRNPPESGVDRVLPLRIIFTGQKREFEFTQHSVVVLSMKRASIFHVIDASQLIKADDNIMLGL